MYHIIITIVFAPPLTTTPLSFGHLSWLHKGGARGACGADGALSAALSAEGKSDS